jgi:hypothetical protein
VLASPYRQREERPPEARTTLSVVWFDLILWGLCVVLAAVLLWVVLAVDAYGAPGVALALAVFGTFAIYSIRPPTPTPAGEGRHRQQVMLARRFELAGVLAQVKAKPPLRGGGPRPAASDQP